MPEICSFSIIIKINFRVAAMSGATICTRIRKPCDRRCCRSIIKCEIGIGLERVISQLRALLGSMPIFITQLTKHYDYTHQNSYLAAQIILIAEREILKTVLRRIGVPVTQIADLRYNCCFHDFHDEHSCDYYYFSSPHENDLV